MVNLKGIEIIDKRYTRQFKDIIKRHIPKEEKVLVALKGTFKEYLICTDKQVHIIKEGYMTGHTFGSGNFKMPYRNITNVQVVFKFATGYFEISSGGIQNTDKSYWGSDPHNSAMKNPNSISLNNAEARDYFDQAGSFINKKIEEVHNMHTIQATSTPSEKLSTVEEIRQYKELWDEGIITEEEFNKKKTDILNG